ncbi:MAG: hydroxyacid dehydrogenase [Acidothermales bacterium]|nr:hydroxyacid dehydrogenase [Acidothermales bacterium]
MPETDVLVTEDVWGPAFDALARDLTVRVEADGWRRQGELPGLLAGVRALVVRNRTRVDRELLEKCGSLRVVARAGVGLDNIDVDAANELGVVVVAPLGANAVSVAEHTLGLALAVARRTVPLDRETRSGGWRRTPGRELSGRTWGLLGFGATARAVARLARALSMTVLAYDPYVPAADAVTAGVTPAGLDEVVAGADVLSVHLPATAETRGLVGAELLARMKPDAILVNVGRGDLVDEDALADALVAGRPGGAALDVRASEPPVPGRLETLDNVVLSPHVAGITAESQHRIADVLATDIRAVLSGAPARAAVGTVKEAKP